MYITAPVQCIICCYSSLACVSLCESDFVSSFCVGVNSKHLQDGRLAIKTTSTRELNCSHHDCLFSHLCWRHFLFVCLVCQGTHIRGHFTASVVRTTCFIHKPVHFRLPRASITPSLSVKKNANFYTQLSVCMWGWFSFFMAQCVCSASNMSVPR